MWLIRLLNRLRLRNDRLTCMRQEDTWTWGDNLGERTKGNCILCQAPIYFEKQNRVFREKVCNRCNPPTFLVVVAGGKKPTGS